MEKPTTLDDLEGHYVLCFKTHASFGDHHENLNADRQTFSDEDVALVSGNMRMFAAVPWRRGVKRSGVIENVDFQGFRTLRFRYLRKWGQHYYIVLFTPLSPFHWSQNTWPWMTLKFLNGLNGYFTLNFYYYELTLRVTCIIYLFTVESVYIQMWPAEICRSGVADRDPEYLESAEKLRIFRRWYVVGTLTNKTNISRPI